MGILKNKISGRALALIVATVILITAGVGATVAYLVAKTPPASNTFTPVEVSCKIYETFDTENNVKRDVTVKNTSDISAYIRCAIIVNWVSDSGTVYGNGPKAGTDYTISLGESGWFVGSDGFYYYEAALEAGAYTEKLINSITPVKGTEPDGYSLSVNIVASAIQSQPVLAVMSAWHGVTVNDNGNLIPKSTTE